MSRRPTEEQIDGFLDVALAKSGTEDVRELALPELGDDVVFFVRSLSRAEYTEYANGAVHDDTRANARTQAVMRTVLWPSRAEINAAREVFGGLDAAVVKQVEQLAGCPKSGDEEWIRFDEDVDAETLAEFGISDAAAADLRARYSSPGHLWICRLRALGAVFVMHRLGVRATEELSRKTQVKGEFYAACLNAAANAIAWPEPAAVQSMLTQHPAVACTVVFPRLFELAKGASAGEAKKVMRSGSRIAG